MGPSDHVHVPQVFVASCADSARIPASRLLSPNSTPFHRNRHRDHRSSDSFNPKRTTPSCANSTNSTSSRHRASTLQISLASLQSQTRRTVSGQQRGWRKRAEERCKSSRTSRIDWRLRPSARSRGGSNAALARARPCSLSGSRACSTAVAMSRLKRSGDERRCSSSVSSAVNFSQRGISRAVARVHPLSCQISMG